MQVGRLAPATFAWIVAVVVEVKEKEDSAHFAPTGNLGEVFLLLHRQLLEFPNMLVDIVAALYLRLHL